MATHKPKYTFVIAGLFKHPHFLNLLFLSLLISSCAEKNTSNSNYGSKNIQENTTVPLTKVTSIYVGGLMTCALDSEQKVACWEHKKKFVPSAPGSTRGSFEIDYPKMTNAHLARFHFVELSAHEESVCAVADSGKVVCFQVEGAPVVLWNNVTSLKNITHLANDGLGNLCVIDTNRKLTCHKLDFTGAPEVDQISSTQEVRLISSGSTRINNSLKTVICMLDTSNDLSCAKIFDYRPRAMPTSAASLYPGVGFSDFIMLSKDKKTIDYIGTRETPTVEKDDGLDYNKIYSDIDAGSFRLCGIVTATNQIECQSENPRQDPKTPKLTNDELQNDKFKKISLGHNFICGLKPNNQPKCWQPKDLTPDVPANIVLK